MVWFFLYSVVALIVIYVWAARNEDPIPGIPLGLAWFIALPILAAMWLGTQTRKAVRQRVADRAEAERKAAYARYEVCQHEADNGGYCRFCEGRQYSALDGLKWRFR